MSKYSVEKINEINSGFEEYYLELYGDGLYKEWLPEALEKSGWKPADVTAEDATIKGLNQETAEKQKYLEKILGTNNVRANYYVIQYMAEKEPGSKWERAYKKVELLKTLTEKRIEECKEQLQKVSAAREAKVNVAEKERAAIVSEIKESIDDYIRSNRRQILNEARKKAEEVWSLEDSLPKPVIKYRVTELKPDMLDKLADTWWKKTRFVYEAAWELNKVLAAIDFSGFYVNKISGDDKKYTMMTIPWFASWGESPKVCDRDGFGKGIPNYSGNSILYFDLTLLRAILLTINLSAEELSKTLCKRYDAGKGCYPAVYISGIPWGFVADEHADMEWIRVGALYGLGELDKVGDLRNLYPSSYHFMNNFPDRLGYVKHECWRAERIKTLYDAAMKAGSEKDKKLAEDMMNVYKSLLSKKYEDVVSYTKTTYILKEKSIHFYGVDYSYTCTTRSDYTEWSDRYLKDNYVRDALMLKIPENWVTEEKGEDIHHTRFTIRMPRVGCIYYGNGCEIQFDWAIDAEKNGGYYYFYFERASRKVDIIRTLAAFDNMGQRNIKSQIPLYLVKLMQKGYKESRGKSHIASQTIAVNLNKNLIKEKTYASGVTKLFITIPDGISYNGESLDDFKAIIPSGQIMTEELPSGRIQCILNPEMEVELKIPAEEDSSFMMSTKDFANLFRKSASNWAGWEEQEEQEE